MQCIFNKPLSTSSKFYSRNQIFLRSGLSWIIWHQRNDLVLNANQWPMEKTHQGVWDPLLHYGRLEWQRLGLKNPG